MYFLFFRLDLDEINGLLINSIEDSCCLNYDELSGLLLNVPITIYIIPGVAFCKFEETHETHVVFLKKYIP